MEVEAPHLSTKSCLSSSCTLICRNKDSFNYKKTPTHMFAAVNHSLWRINLLFPSFLTTSAHQCTQKTKRRGRTQHQWASRHKNQSPIYLCLLKTFTSLAGGEEVGWSHRSGQKSQAARLWTEGHRGVCVYTVCVCVSLGLTPVWGLGPLSLISSGWASPRARVGKHCWNACPSLWRWR